MKEYCFEFDYGDQYAPQFFHALREQLADVLWRHLLTLLQDDPNQQSFPETTEKPRNQPINHRLKHKGLSVKLAEAMYKLFDKFNDLHKKCIRASPLTRDLLIDLKAETLKENDLFQRLIEALSDR